MLLRLTLALGLREWSPSAGPTVITSFNADYLVGAIDEVAKNYGIPKASIGIILLPIVGNAAEHVTAVVMAYKGKMEIAVAVAVGSSIQIAVGVIPALVIVSWAIGQPLTVSILLAFRPFGVSIFPRNR
ncbi:unnamed protein product [Tilletia controversa]|nr:unnamed protein product [Tilletia controversa]